MECWRNSDGPIIWIVDQHVIIIIEITDIIDQEVANRSLLVLAPLLDGWFPTGG